MVGTSIGAAFANSTQENTPAADSATRADSSSASRRLKSKNMENLRGAKKASRCNAGAAGDGALWHRAYRGGNRFPLEPNAPCSLQPGAAEAIEIMDQIGIELERNV